MGRSSLLLVMGLGIVFGIIGLSIRGATNSLMEAQTGYTKYCMARDLAAIGIHRQLRYYDRGVTPPAQVYYNNGEYTIATATSGDTLWITSVGQYAESSYTVKCKLLHTPKPFPPVKAAVGSSAHPTTINYNGQAAIDGRNYDSTGTNLVGTGNLPAVALWTAQDSINAAVNASHLTGTGNPPISVDTTQPNPNNFMNEYKASATYSFTAGTVSGNQTFGSYSNPVIVDCDAGPDTTITITFTGNITGYGILAIRGNVVFSGTFNWFGLIVCYGNNNVVNLQQQGASSITGGLMVGGNAGASLTLKGTGPSNKIKYSSQALSKARNIAPLLYYQILEWYE